MTDRPDLPAADPAGTAPVVDGDACEVSALTERQRAMVAFEAGWWMEDAARDTLIRARFACSTEEYYRELNELLDHPGALSFDPLVVRRLRRQRERRRRARIDGPAGDGATGERGGRNA